MELEWAAIHSPERGGDVHELVSGEHRWCLRLGSTGAELRGRVDFRVR